MSAGVAPTSPHNIVWQPPTNSCLCLACTTTHNLADTSSTTHCPLRKGNHSAHDNRLDPNFTAGSCLSPRRTHTLLLRKHCSHVPLRLSVPTPPCCRCYPTMWACPQVLTTKKPGNRARMHARAQHVSTLATTHALTREKGGITSTVHHIPHVPHVGLNSPMHAHNVSCLSNARSQRAPTPCSLRTPPSVLLLTQHAPSRSCTHTPTRTTAASNITDDNQHQTSVGVSQTHGGRAVTPACKGGCQCRQVQRRKHATRRAH